MNRARFLAGVGVGIAVTTLKANAATMGMIDERPYDWSTTVEELGKPLCTPNEVMLKESRYLYSETIARLSKAITDAGNQMFATIDQARAAAEAGLTLRPTMLLIFGNPKGGTPLMDALPLFAFELPLRFLVWEEGSGVKVAYARMLQVAKAYRVPATDPRIAAMDHMLDSISAAVT
jgi:uncharacterized protein (DUF302 family)